MVAISAPSHHLGWVKLLRARLAIAPRYVEVQNKVRTSWDASSWITWSFPPATWSDIPAILTERDYLIISWEWEYVEPSQNMCRFIHYDLIKPLQNNVGSRQPRTYRMKSFQRTQRLFHLHWNIEVKNVEGFAGLHPINSTKKTWMNNGILARAESRHVFHARQHLCCAWELRHTFRQGWLTVHVITLRSKNPIPSEKVWF